MPEKRKRRAFRPTTYLVIGLILGMGIAAAAIGAVLTLRGGDTPVERVEAQNFVPTAPPFVPPPMPTVTPMMAVPPTPIIENSIFALDVAGERMVYNVWDGNGRAQVYVRDIDYDGFSMQSPRLVYESDKLVDNVKISPYPVGQKVAVLHGGFNELKIVDVATGDVLMDRLGQAAASFDLDGQYLAIAGMNGGVRLLDADTLDFIRALPLADDISINELTFSADTRYLAAAAWMNGQSVAYIWDMQNPDAAPEQYVIGERINDLVFSPDGEKLVLAASSAVIWVDRANAERRYWQFDMGRVYSVDFSADGEWLAAGGGQVESGRGAGVYVWRWHSDALAPDDPSWQEPLKLFGHEHNVHGLSFTPHINYLLSASRDGTIRMWDFQRQREVMQDSP